MNGKAWTEQLDDGHRTDERSPFRRLRRNTGLPNDARDRPGDRRPWRDQAAFLADGATANHYFYYYYYRCRLTIRGGATRDVVKSGRHFFKYYNFFYSPREIRPRPNDETDHQDPAMTFPFHFLHIYFSFLSSSFVVVFVSPWYVSV